MPQLRERTGPQVASSTSVFATDGELDPRGLSSSDLKKMKKHPTVQLVYRLFQDLVLSAQWSVDIVQDSEIGAEQLEKAQKFIAQQFLPQRRHFLRTSTTGCLDKGWRGYEFIVSAEESEFRLKKLKSLIHRDTTILTNKGTGAYEGLKQEIDETTVVLNIDQSLLINDGVEGTDWRGAPRIEATEGPWRAHVKVEAASERYDDKTAGAFWVVHYPLGTSKINGTDTDNFEIAKDLIAKLKSSGSLVVPRSMDDTVGVLNDQAKEPAWKIELLSDSGASSTHFVQRQKYLDSLIVRSLGFTERSVLEGQFGTKAEAGEHADLAITGVEEFTGSIVEQLNWHGVNRLLRWNFGSRFENQVRITPQPIVDSEKEFLRDVYRGILSSNMQAEEYDRIDRDSVRQRLNIPSEAATENDDLLPEPSPEPSGGFPGTETG